VPGNALLARERVSIGVLRAPQPQLAPRVAAMITPPLGAVWAIAAASGARMSELVVVCSDLPVPTTRVSTYDHSGGGPTVVATRGGCVARVASHGSASIASLEELAAAEGETRIFAELDGTLIGLGGTVRDGEFRVSSASPTLVHADLDRAQREVVVALATLTPAAYQMPRTLTIALPRERRHAVLDALQRVVEGACEVRPRSVRCTLPSERGFDAFAALAFAAYLTE
jgi:hypothetical protein